MGDQDRANPGLGGTLPPWTKVIPMPAPAPHFVRNGARVRRIGGAGPAHRARGLDPSGNADAAPVPPECLSLAGTARVTGSGGSSCSAASANPAGTGSMIALPHGAALSFASLAEFRPERFL